VAEYALNLLPLTPCVHKGVVASKGAHDIPGFVADEPGEVPLRINVALRL